MKQFEFGKVPELSLLEKAIRNPESLCDDELTLIFSLVVADAKKVIH